MTHGNGQDEVYPDPSQPPYGPPHPPAPPQPYSPPPDAGYGYGPPGQPYGQAPPPAMPYQAYPAPRARRTWMLVCGIPLTLWGALATLVLLSTVTSSFSPGSDDGAGTLGYVIGYLLGITLFALAPLVIGIVMIVRSRPR